MRHAVMYFPWGCQLSTSSEHSEFQIEGETDEDVMLQVEQVMERYYQQFFKGKPTEAFLGFCEDGEPVNMTKIGDTYNVKVSVTLMLEPKRSAKKREKEDDIEL